MVNSVCACHAAPKGGMDAALAVFVMIGCCQELLSARVMGHVGAMRCLAFLMTLPIPAAAGPYDGVYKQTANSECSLVGVDGGSLEISESIFHGVEAECRMVRPVDINDMDATIYDMECFGEGETWTERAVIMHDAAGEGIYMIWDGYVFRYDRCEPGEH